jgi:hypothetical protein
VRNLRLKAGAKGSITVTFTAPKRGGAPTDYLLTCRRGPRGASTSAVVTASGTTVSGFARGYNVCRLVSRNAAGESRAASGSVRVR